MTQLVLLAHDSLFQSRYCIRTSAHDGDDEEPSAEHSARHQTVSVCRVRR